MLSLKFDGFYVKIGILHRLLCKMGYNAGTISNHVDVLSSTLDRKTIIFNFSCNVFRYQESQINDMCENLNIAIINRSEIFYLHNWIKSLFIYSPNFNDIELALYDMDKSHLICTIELKEYKDIIDCIDRDCYFIVMIDIEEEEMERFVKVTKQYSLSILNKT